MATALCSRYTIDEAHLLEADIRKRDGHLPARVNTFVEDLRRPGGVQQVAVSAGRVIDNVQLAVVFEFRNGQAFIVQVDFDTAGARGYVVGTPG